MKPNSLTPVLLGVLLVSACGGGDDAASDPGVASSGEPRAEVMVVRTEVSIAATSGADVIATGEILDGSTLGGAPFCDRGAILDTHASSDPEVLLIDRMIICQDGTVRVHLTPDLRPGLKDTGTWKIISGTGAFEGLTGRGEMTITYDPDDEALAHERYSGTVTR